MEIRRWFYLGYAALSLALIARLFVIYSNVLVLPWHTAWKTIGIVLSNGGWDAISTAVVLAIPVKMAENIICE